ncbi:MAG: triose-phosphate isomerase [Candidatus Eisenbacteria bacterium]|nr:triose-phosphate isomerase [Candidatus Eisenbacteria bacterium]
MTRRRPIAGNWKMNGTLEEAGRLIDGILAGAAGAPDTVDLLVFPAFPHLSEVGRRVAGSRIALGAQDLFWEPKGAFTGEVSGAMLRDAGCTHVLVGHSERRVWFGESGDTLLKKLRAARREGLLPILCIGENLAEREAGRTEEVLERQLADTLFQLTAAEAASISLAYEPVWAIGTGRNATPEQAEEAHAFLRRRIGERFDAALAKALSILYGGSVNAANAKALLARDGVDGALVGGASLDAAQFLAIAAAVTG